MDESATQLCAVYKRCNLTANKQGSYKERQANKRQRSPVAHRDREVWPLFCNTFKRSLINKKSLINKNIESLGCIPETNFTL